MNKTKRSFFKNALPARLSLGVIGTIAFLFILPVQAYPGIISYSPTSPNVEQSVAFVLNPAPVPPQFVTNLTWDFGDGTTGGGGLTITHAYQRTGTFTVKATYTDREIPYTDTTTITVLEKRRIDYSPLNPRPLETVTFTAVNFLSESISWDFGDGTQTQLGTSPQTHVYQNPGTYTVNAKDFGGQAVAKLTTTVTVRSTGSIGFAPAKPRVGEAVTFTATNFVSPTNIRWDFGDGSVLNLPPPTATHIYNQPGTYQVRAYDGGGAYMTASVSVQVYPPATIAFSPADPRQGESITFSAGNLFATGPVRWDFGDGTILDNTSLQTVSHTYANAGTYQVKISEAGALRISISGRGRTNDIVSIMITVSPPRLITFSPQKPRSGELISFQAVNFLSSSLSWDYGDGSAAVKGGTQASHAYQKDGSFVVTANDTRDGAPFPVRTTVTVAPSVGPRALFSVSYINLRFADGKSYRAVQKGYSPLTSYAEIKYEGSGILQAQWMVDGNPFRLISKNCIQAEQLIIDSGEVPGLPTINPGLHQITLKILQPETTYAIPIIQYFVSASEKKELENVEAEIIQVQGLEGQNVQLRGQTIVAPEGKYFLIRGTVKSGGQTPIPILSLGVYYEDNLIDQKIIRNLLGGERRVYETSVMNSSREPKKLVLRIYDVSEKTALLLWAKEWTVAAK